MTTTEDARYLARPERALIDSAVDHIYDLLGQAGYHWPYAGLFDPIAEALAALLDAAAEQSTPRGAVAQLDGFEARLDACEAIAQKLAGRSEVTA